MNPVYIPNETLMAQLAELIDGTNLYVGGKVHCYKAPVAFDPNMDLTAFTECDFTGYAASSTVVFTDPFISPEGVPTIAGGVKEFRVGATPTIFNTVYGWYLTNAGGTVLLFWREFESPIALTLPLQGFDVVPTVPAYLTY